MMPARRQRIELAGLHLVAANRVGLLPHERSLHVNGRSPRLGIERRQPAEDLIAVAIVFVIGVRDDNDLIARPLRHTVQHDQPIARRHAGQRLKNDGLEPGEDRGVRADAQRERDDGDQCEAGLLQQHSRAEAQVLPECLHNSPKGRCQMSDVRCQ